MADTLKATNLAFCLMYFLSRTGNRNAIDNISWTSFNTLSVENNKTFDTILLYPNPTHNILYLKTNLRNIETLDIFDCTGRLVKRINTVTISNIASQVNVSSLKSGLYFVKVSVAGTTSVLRFVKR